MATDSLYVAFVICPAAYFNRSPSKAIQHLSNYFVNDGILYSAYFNY